MSKKKPKAILLKAEEAAENKRPRLRVDPCPKRGFYCPSGDTSTHDGTALMRDIDPESVFNLWLDDTDPDLAPALLKMPVLKRRVPVDGSKISIVYTEMDRKYQPEHVRMVARGSAHPQMGVRGKAIWLSGILR